MNEVIIVGAGLSGLSAAYYLRERGVNALVIEARSRLGGRIETIPAQGNNTPVEMGATWFADKHIYMMKLLRELELSYYKQFQKGIAVFEPSTTEEPQVFHMPEGEEASYRISGGTLTLINALADKIGRNRIITGTPLVSVTEGDDYIEIETSGGEKYACRNLVLTIPPFLIVAQGIVFNPPLPGQLRNIMENTHTWMGEAIKFAVEYDSPFWKKKGYAGTAFSHAGIATEFYDHSNAEETHFALKGFLHPEASALPAQERERRLIRQLTRLLGKEAASYLSYTERVWQHEAYTYADYGKYIMPHQNNSHPLYSQPLMHHKLYLAGTETSPYYGGYMDGAVYGGLAAAQHILQKLSSQA